MERAQGSQLIVHKGKGIKHNKIFVKKDVKSQEIIRYFTIIEFRKI